MFKLHVLLTRPEPDSTALGRVLKDMGVESTAAPLLEIIYQDGPPLNLDGVQALLFTSANGVRAFARRSDARGILALAVGDATARELAALNFKNIESAGGDVDTLAALVIDRLASDNGELLHAAGSRLAGDLEGMLVKAGFKYRRSILYRAETPAALAPATINALEQENIDGVLFYSPRTAKTFASLVVEAGQQEKLGAMTAYCLSPRVSHMVKDLGWAEIKVADKPEQSSLLALLGG